MNINYTLTLEEYLEAHKLHEKRSQTILYHFIFAGILTFYLLTTFDTSSNDAIAASLVPAIIAILSYLSFIYFVLPRSQKDKYYQSPILSQPMQFTLNDNNLSITTIENTTTIDWTTFHKWDKNENIYNIYISPTQYYTVPIRAIGKVGHAKLENSLTKNGIHQR